MVCAISADYSVKIKENEKTIQVFGPWQKTKKAVEVMLIMVSELETVPKDFERRLEELEIGRRIETL